MLYTKIECDHKQTYLLCRLRLLLSLYRRYYYLVYQIIQSVWKMELFPYFAIVSFKKQKKNDQPSVRYPV